jgi:hypothetical protein
MRRDSPPASSTALKVIPMGRGCDAVAEGGEPAFHLAA